MLPQEITDSISHYFTSGDPASFRITATEPLAGGSINEVYRLHTSHGTYCLKYNLTASYPGMFEAEEKGLRLLASAGEIRVPEPLLAVSAGRYSFLLMEYLSPGRPREDMMQRLGVSLARLHSHSSEKFGLDHSNYMGSLPQPNNRHVDWPGFFRQERLEPQVRMARDTGRLPAQSLSRFESLYAMLDQVFPPEPPSLVHGDLWSGNYYVSADGDAALIDPAAFYGHRETDIAMSTLFGGFSNDFYESYRSEFPLLPGWRDRLDIFNLYPLLVHLNLFGGGYLGQVLGIIRKF